MPSNQHDQPGHGFSRTTWVLIGFLAIALYFVLSEHRAHFINFLPYILLAACPLMHLFHGHGGHGSHHDEGARRDAPRAGMHEHHEGGSR